MEEELTMEEIERMRDERVEALMERKARLEDELQKIGDELTKAGILFTPQKGKPARRQYRVVLRKLLEPGGMLVDSLISDAARDLTCDQKHVREAFERWAAIDKSVIVSEDEEHRDFVHIKKEE